MSEEDKKTEERTQAPVEVEEVDSGKLSSWGASGVAAELTRRGMETMEKEDFQQAHVYFELALQFQPQRLIPRKKIVELSQYDEMRDKTVVELQEILDRYWEGEDLSQENLTFDCPSCGTTNPAGVRICRCGLSYKAGGEEKWSAAASVEGGTSFPMSMLVVNVFLVILSLLILYQVSQVPKVEVIGDGQNGKAQFQKIPDDLKKEIEKIKSDQSTLITIFSGLSSNQSGMAEKLNSLEDRIKKLAPQSTEFPKKGENKKEKKEESPEKDGNHQEDNKGKGDSSGDE